MTLKVNYDYFSGVGGIAGNVFGAWRRLGLEPLNFKFKTNDYRKHKR